MVDFVWPNKVREGAATDEMRIGVDIVGRVVEVPLKQIADNAGVDGGVVAQKVKESKDVNFGDNSPTHEYGNLMQMGVIISEIKEGKEPAGAGGGMY